MDGCVGGGEGRLLTLVWERTGVQQVKIRRATGVKLWWVVAQWTAGDAKKTANRPLSSLLFASLRIDKLSGPPILIEKQAGEHHGEKEETADARRGVEAGN